MLYRSPPLREAICEFHFRQGARWNGTTAGRLQARLDGYPDAQDVREAVVSFGPRGLEVPAQSSPAVQLWATDRRRLVQVGPGWLAVNRLQPYGSWDDFRIQIREALDAYAAETSTETVDSASLTYLNVVDLPDGGGGKDGSYDITDYFAFRPAFGCFGTAPAREAGASVVFEESAEMDMPARYTVSVRVLPEKGALAQLTLTAQLLRPRSRPLADVLGWLEGSHGQIETYFEGAITDRLRSLFDPVDSL